MSKRIIRFIVSLVILSMGGVVGVKSYIANKAKTAVDTVTSRVSEIEWEPAAVRIGDGRERETIPEVLFADTTTTEGVYDDVVTYDVVNGNQPYFTAEDMTTEPFEIYSDLDELGRCGVAYANICEELMPTEDREEELTVRPSGYQVAVYDGIDNGGYLYNRCHLIGYFLAGENDNELNLVTGTRYFNCEGMLPFEMEVGEYVWETGNHVLYRVTPVFEGNDLVCTGVEMEAYSVEDHGEGVCYNVFVYNIQPGIEIDYSTGNSWEEE